MIKTLVYSIIHSLLLLVPILISVAYLTLAERKILGYSQSRKGPNVVGIYGILQPLADGVKLFTKELLIPNHVNIYFYLLSPILALTISLLVWFLFPWNMHVPFSPMLSLIMLLALSSIGIYSLLLSGWSSNSKYAFLGSIRAAAQMISFEVSLGLIFLIFVLITKSLNVKNFVDYQTFSGFLIFSLWPLAILFFISSLAETNRAPFDLTEGESELVSGYNVEYSSMSFALFFLAEYSHIIFMSYFFTLLFLANLNHIFFCLMGSLITFVFIWIRTSFPRLRYDQLMHLLWKRFLPLSIFLVMLVNSIIWAFNSALI